MTVSSFAGPPLTTNPVVDIYVHDLETGERTHLEICDGQHLTDDEV